MAEYAVNSVVNAVTSELISRVLSGLVQRYGKDAATSEKLQRLEMLLIKIHSAIEASEKRTIENSWLLRWRDKLKEAVSRGDEVLAKFLQQAKEAQATSNTEANQHQGEAASSSSAAPATAVSALSFTRKSLSGMVQGIRRARKMLFSSGHDNMERLNRTLEKLEKLWLDIGEFIRLLRFEALTKVDQTRYATLLSTSTRVHGPTKKMRTTRANKRMKRLTNSYPASRPSLTILSPLKEEMTEIFPDEFCLSQMDDLEGPARAIDLECDSSAVQKEQQHTLPQNRLEVAFAAICKAVELAGSHNLEDLKWLPYWAGILVEAEKQGCAVLGAMSTGKTINAEDNGESMVEFDQEKDELRSFVHRLEGLASDVEYFNKLVYLCRVR